MPNILDHVSSTPVLEIDVWSRSATRKEWFAITRLIIQDTIADMNLDPAAESEVIDAFIRAGLLEVAAGADKLLYIQLLRTELFTTCALQQ